MLMTQQHVGEWKITVDFGSLRVLVAVQAKNFPECGARGEAVGQICAHV